jgi:hypothetical protein
MRRPTRMAITCHKGTETRSEVDVVSLIDLSPSKE